MKVPLLASAAIATLAVKVSADPLHMNLDLNIKLNLEEVDFKIEQESHTTNAKQPYQASNACEKPDFTPPIVNLSYEDHQASCYDNRKFWNFSNIPYAKPPIKELRFREAQHIDAIDGEKPLNIGENSTICPQMQVGWVPPAVQFLGDYFGGKDINNWTQPIEAYDYEPIGPQNISKLVSEDCLTLDVMVPKTTWDTRTTQKRPVLVWIFGGGFIFGSKILLGSPEGLMAASGSTAKDDFIYVALNYRLGAFGFLSGDNFESEGGFENAGLSDQLVALEWVRDNIEKFGGDPNKVTVMGQSAGAASIQHHITSNGGKGDPPPFQRAVLQSPAFFPNVDRVHMNKIYMEFLHTARALDLDHLRRMDTEELIWANAVTTYEAKYGQFGYGPVVDDTYVPELTSELLKTKKFHKNITTMISYNRQEGMLFTPPWIRTREAFGDYVISYFPDFDRANLTYLLDGLYPIEEDPDPATVQTEKNKVLQVAEALGDLAVDCNTFYMKEAKEGDVYYYRINFFPGLHGQDTDYTFNPIPADERAFPPPIPFSLTQARALQHYLTNFIKTGEPGQSTIAFPANFNKYSKDEQIFTFGKWGPGGVVYYDTYGMVENSLNETKCEFWWKAPYAPKKLRGERAGEGGGKVEKLIEQKGTAGGVMWEGELKA